MYRKILFLAVLFVLFLPGFFLIAQTVDTTPIATNLTRPIAVVDAGDGSGRLFIVQQTGQILIYDGTQVLATPFLDLSSKVECCGERGLLSLAFHPGYGTTSDFFYVYYTKKTTFEVTIARYTVTADPNVADPNSELVIKSIPHNLHPNHNGGTLQFNPIDGLLYISIGDGGGGGDPEGNGQDLASLLGKMLRLDVDAADPYIPPNNPFVNDMDPNTLGEIWAFGLRNPWRFTFDRSTGNMYIGDVGQNCWEEVNFRPFSNTGGDNYGWNIIEGPKCYDISGGGSNCNLPPTCMTQIPNAITPVIFYSHTLPNVQAVTGGYLYRGAAMPSFVGTYFFADYASGQIWNAVPGGTSWSFIEVASTGNLISSFGEDEAGELYYTSLGFTATDGAVYKLSAPSSLPYSDDFNDNDVTDWNATKGTWGATGGELQATTVKKAEIHSPFGGCSVCTIETDIRIDSPSGKVSLLGWYRSKGEMVELMLNSDKDVLLLKDHSGGGVGSKIKASMTIDQGVSYHIKIAFDGAQFQVFIDGSATPILTLQATGASGGAGYRLKSNGGRSLSAGIDQISIN